MLAGAELSVISPLFNEVPQFLAKMQQAQGGGNSLLWLMERVITARTCARGGSFRRGRITDDSDRPRTELTQMETISRQTAHAAVQAGSQLWGVQVVDYGTGTVAAADVPTYKVPIMTTFDPVNDVRSWEV